MPAVSERVPADEGLQKARFALRIQELCRDDEDEEDKVQTEEHGVLASSQTWASSRAAALGSTVDKDKALLRTDSAEKIAAEMDSVLLQLRQWQQHNKSDLAVRLARNLQLLEEAYAPSPSSVDSPEAPGSLQQSHEGVDSTQQQSAAESTSGTACSADMGSSAATGAAYARSSRSSSSARASCSSSSGGNSRLGSTSTFALSRRLPSQHAASGQAATHSAATASAAATAAPAMASASSLGNNAVGTTTSNPPLSPLPGLPSSRPVSGQAWSRAALEGSAVRVPAMALSRPSTSSSATLPPNAPSAACSSSASLCAPSRPTSSSSNSSSNGNTDGHCAVRAVRPQLLPTLSSRPQPPLSALSQSQPHPGWDGSSSLGSSHPGGSAWGSNRTRPLSSQPQQQQQATHSSSCVHAQQQNSAPVPVGTQPGSVPDQQHVALGESAGQAQSPPLGMGSSSSDAHAGGGGRGQELLDELEAELRELDAEEQKPGGITEWHSDVARLLAQMDLLQTGYQVGDRDGQDTSPATRGGSLKQ